MIALCMNHRISMLSIGQGYTFHDSTYVLLKECRNVFVYTVVKGLFEFRALTFDFLVFFYSNSSAGFSLPLFELNVIPIY